MKRQNSWSLLAVAVLSHGRALACSALGGAWSRRPTPIADRPGRCHRGPRRPRAARLRPKPTAARPGGPTSAPRHRAAAAARCRFRAATSGLDKLKSYQASRWLAEWKSTDSPARPTAAGLGLGGRVFRPTRQALALELDALRVPPTRPRPWPTASKPWQVGNTTYLQTVDANGKQSCISMSSDDKSNQLSKGLFNPEHAGQRERCQIRRHGHGQRRQG